MELLPLENNGQRLIVGDYHGLGHKIRIHPEHTTNLYIMLHEIAHGVCLKKMRYFGSHGVPYLVLHDLLIHFYLPTLPLGNGLMVDDQWPVWTGGKWRNSVKDETKKIVADIISECAKAGVGWTPSIDELAKLVSASTAKKYCFAWRGRVFQWFRWLDRAWTQKGSVLQVISKVLFLCFMLSIVIAFTAHQIYLWTDYGIFDAVAKTASSALVRTLFSLVALAAFYLIITRCAAGLSKIRAAVIKFKKRF